MWCNSNGISLPFHLILPQHSHFFSFLPSIISLFNNLYDWYVEFSVNIKSRDFEILGLNFNPTFQPCPVKWE